MDITSSGRATHRHHAVKRAARVASVLHVGTGLFTALTILVFIAAIVWLIVLPTANNGPNEMPEVNELNGLYEMVVNKPQFFTASFGGDVNLNPDNLNPTVSVKIIVFAITTINFLIALYSITRLHFLFGNFKRQEIFIQRNSSLLRSLGYAIIAMMIFGWVVYWSSTIMAAKMDQHADDVFSIGTDGNFPLKALVIGSIFLLAWVIDVGCELRNETEQTI